MLKANEVNDSVKLMDLHQEYETAQTQQEHIFSEWEEASLALELFYETYPQMRA